MPNVYTEARPKGRPEGSPIEDYVVEDHADHALSAHKTQEQAIAWAKKQCKIVIGVRVVFLPVQCDLSIKSPSIIPLSCRGHGNRRRSSGARPPCP